MKLRKVEIIGFKSFRDKVVVEIGDGMTGIVGPNGCGKSNVVDAIKWAMGDGSAKSLRGQSMQDVIFAGSQNHKPLSMAEVTLTFENDYVASPQPNESTPKPDDLLRAILDDSASTEPDEDNENKPTDPDSDAISDEVESDNFGSSIPSEFREMAEIAITRRLFRSGDSEYLINKVPCRLMDIQNLLAGTGVGKQGYSIIEQGQISFIVNARPSQRRLIIEEASGITRYKSQRDRTERRLLQTEQNLQRTRDVIEEIDKQLRSLERQARRAQEHRTLSEELRTLEISALLERRVQLFLQRTNVQTTLDAQNQELANIREVMAAREARAESFRVEAHVAEARHTEITQQFYQLDTRVNLARSNRDHAQQGVTDASERRQALIIERDGQTRRAELLTIELERARAELAELSTTPEQSEHDIASVQDAITELRKQRSTVVARRDELRSELARMAARFERIDDRLSWIATQRKELLERQAQAQDLIEAAQEEVEDAQRAGSRLEMDQERLEKDHTQLAARAERQTKELGEARDALKEADEDARKARSLRIQLEARLESLDAMRKRGDGYGDGVQNVLAWAQQQGRADILGPAGGFLDVPDGWEAAAAAYLGDRVSDILVTSRAAALDAIQMLAEKRLGRIACYIIEGGEDPEVRKNAMKGWLDGLERVDSLENIEIQSAKNTNIQAWATPRGDIMYANGRIIGGFATESADALIRQTRQIEELRTAFEQAKTEDDEAQETLEVCEEDATYAADQLESTREALAQAQHDLRAIIQEQEAEQRQMARAEEHLEKVTREANSFPPLLAGLQEEVETLQESRAQALQDNPAMQVEYESLAESITNLEGEIERQNTRLTDQKVQIARERERHSNLTQSVERLDNSLKHAQQQVARFERESIAAAERLEHFENVVITSETELKDLHQDFTDAGIAVKDAKIALDRAQLGLKELEQSLAEGRRQIESLAGSIQKLEMEQRECTLGIDHVDEQLEERFGLTPFDAKPFAASVEMPVEQRPARIQMLRKKIESMGAVNALAIEEYEETRERKVFLDEQNADLERALEDLRKAIDRMDRESKKRFLETYAAVNAKFQEVFPRLFRGGRARLLLTDPDDPLNTGVDIEVQPPGKALQNVTLLSGGEKALTAVSLIFSIFMLKPTPFSILDEVDAPLDEANVGRFADMVKEMSETSQMIVITHNRRTMEAPKRLYGVTMQEPGVSKVVSVRLTDMDDQLAS